MTIQTYDIVTVPEAGMILRLTRNPAVQSVILNAYEVPCPNNRPEIKSTPGVT
jgi:hypothetical protein